MKRTKGMLALALAGALLLGGCAGQQAPPEQLTEMEKNDQRNNFIGLTPEQKQEDFAYLCETLDTLYPFWGELADQGIEKEQLFAAYRERAEQASSDISFLNEIGQLFKELQGRHNMGHLYLMGKQQYEDMVETYNRMDFGDSWRAVLQREETVYTYSKLSSNTNGWNFLALDGLGQGERAVPLAGNGGLRIEMINDGKTGYIHIPSFSGDFMDTEGPRVEAFLAESAPLEDVIIDIRGNGGGSTSYWQYYIVRPNLKEEQKTTNYFLFRDELLQNQQAMKFVDEKHPALRQQYRPISELPAMDHLTPHAAEFDHLVQEVQRYVPQADAEPYQGRIWLLIDSRNYSAAEGFIGFCKQTGFATVVGERSGGNDPYGEPVFFALPNSGLVWKMDLFYPLNPDGSCNGICGPEPDIECAAADALDVCLAEINKG